MSDATPDKTAAHAEKGRVQRRGSPLVAKRLEQVVALVTSVPETEVQVRDRGESYSVVMVPPPELAWTAHARPDPTHSLQFFHSGPYAGELISATGRMEDIAIRVWRLPAEAFARKT